MPTSRLLIDDHPVPLASRAAALPLWETVVILAAALLYWTDLLRLMFPGTDGVSLGFRLTHFSFYGIFVLLLLRDLPALGRGLAAAPLLALLLLLPLLSGAWSINPQESVQRAIALIGSSLFGLYLATQIPPLTTLRLLGITGLLATVISFVLIFFFPSIGLMSEGEYVNVWSGAYVHKNGMGQGAMLGAIICMIVLLTDGVRRNWLLAIGLVLSLLLLAGSRSLTSQMVFIASAVLVFTIGRFVRILFDHAMVLAVLVSPLLLMAAASLSVDDLFELLALTGKDATMSSRLPLWQLLQPFLADRFWLGHGYEAFWGEENYAIGIIEARLHFKPHYAHNGFIELWLGLGALGFAVMAALFLRFAYKAGRLLYDDDRNAIILLAFVYVPMFLIQNMAEVTILQRNSMNWVLFVMLYVYLAKAVGPPPAAPEAVPLRRPRLPVA